MLALAPVAARAQSANPVVPITGSAADGQTFDGTFTVSHFQQIGHVIFAVGTLTGALSQKGAIPPTAAAIPVTAINDTSMHGTANPPARGFGGSETGALTPRLDVAPAAFHPATGSSSQLRIVQTATCPILNLTLGPLDLDLLGLMVHLNQVVLNITATQAPGALLGDLLCAVANLLNPGGAATGALAQITSLLNQILGVLNGL